MDQTSHQRHEQPTSSNQTDFIKSLGQFFQRDLISIPLVKRYPHNQITQRCGLKAATLELDTAAYPNIEYIAGDRLSVYPVNPSDHVSAVMKHLIDDITPLAATYAAAAAASIVTTKQAGSSSPASPSSTSSLPSAKRRRKELAAIVGPRMSEPWAQFLATNGKESVRLALAHLYDITTAPSRDLLRLMAECCSDKEHKSKLIHLSKSDEIWEHWVCQNLRTLKSTLEEFSSCKISAKSLFSELHLQQPRQYSISSIKSSKRFRTEIIVMQHKFDQKLIANHINILKDHQLLESSETGAGPKSPQPASVGPMRYHPTTVHVNHLEPRSMHSVRSVRSLRPMIPFSTSPISMQQVKRVPPFAGPLMSLYAQSSLNATKSKSSIEAATKSLTQFADKECNSSQMKQFEGLCSNYLLNLKPNEQVVCEVVENPRFTMKGNRERPIMMIGQDIGVLAFRAFWQQRALEHDRAQIFYDLFKDLSPKKFGDMQLVCITGNKCKIEDLFRRELDSVLTLKVLSSVTFINKSHLANLLGHAATKSLSSSTTSKESRQNSRRSRASQELPIESKDVTNLGERIAKLLTDGNGCLYTCCDPQMTQAIELLAVESIARSGSSLSRDTIMSLIPKWKGRRTKDSNTNDSMVMANKQLKQTLVANTKGEGQKFFFTLENPFEQAQIVQEIYDLSL